MRKKIKQTISCSLLMALWALNNSFAANINQIVIKGSTRIEQDTILSYLNYKVGDHMDDSDINKAIHNLYSTGFFEKIKVDIDSGRLTIDVKENPVINKVILEGNSRKGESDILPELYTRKGDSLNKGKLDLDLLKIKEIYKKSGRFLVNAKVKIEKITPNTANIIFQISEGPKTNIKNIYFVGNQAYKDHELRSVLITKQDNIFRFGNEATYDPDKIEYDKDLITRFYKSLGYFDFRIISATAELSPKKNGFDLTYVLEEGPLYRFEEIDFDNKIKEIEDKIVQQLIKKIKPGDVFDQSKIDSINEQIRDILANKGFLNLVVINDYKEDRKNKTVKVAFVLRTAPKYYINQLNISGNSKTYDKIIRRRFDLSEGDLFNKSLLTQAERRLYRTGYFETVKIMPSIVNNSANMLDINVEVEERSTASAHLQGSYSTGSDGFGYGFGLQEHNLFGTGKVLSLGTDITKNSIFYSAGVQDPFFMDRDLSAGVKISHSYSGGTSYQAYNRESNAISLNSSYNISDEVSHTVIYTLKRSTLNNKNLDADVQKRSMSISVQESLGTRDTSSISNVLTYDALDNRYAPKNGYITSLTQEYAGLGGDAKFLKHDLSFKFLKSFVNNKYTFKLAVDGGVITAVDKTNKLILDEKFYLGEFNFRGFEMKGMGPREKETGEALGGKYYYTVTTELSFPLGLAKELNINGSIFADFGCLWGVDKTQRLTEDKISMSNMPRMSVGIGFTWITPMMPIRVDYAIPLRYEEYDERKRLHIKMDVGI